MFHHNRLTLLLTNALLALLLIILSVWATRNAYQWFSLNYMVHGYLIYKCPADIASEYVNSYMGAHGDFCSTIEHQDSLIFMPDQANILDKTSNWSRSISYTNSLVMDGKPLSNERVYYKIW